MIILPKIARPFIQKRILLLLLIISGTLYHLNATACDACGGGNNNFVGLLPQLNKRFIGLRYKHSQFKLRPEQLSSLDYSKPQQPHRETYEQYEIWSRFYLTKNVQLMTFVPYGFNTKSESGISTKINGIGDISTLVSVVLVNNNDNLNRKVKHALLAGIGVKLPSGKHLQRDERKVMLPPRFQIGSGAYSALFQLIYTSRYNNLGFNSTTTVSYNGKSELDYRFGNSLTSGGTLFYVFKLKNMQLLPTFGCVLENQSRDQEFGVNVPQTGGWQQYVSSSAELYLGSYAWSLAYQSPLARQKPHEAPISRGRLTASFSVVF